MFSPNTSGYQVKRWRQLSEQAQHRVFLPSLLELTIAPSSSLHPNIFLWIRTFLSPSLTSIVVEAGPEGSLFTIPGLVAKSLLGHIETTCDNLQRLQLFTAAVEDCETTSERTELAIADFWEHSFFERLGGLRLQKLGCTTELLSFDWIHLLGELPTLKSLDLYTVRCEIADQPEDLPHLEHFGIHFASSVDIELIAELGLLSGLKSLTMSFKEIFSLLMEDGWEKSIITSISRDSPELTKLHVDFTDACDCVPKMSSFRPLGALPLTEVCFKGGINVENDQMEDLAATWPNVIRFELWDTDGVLGLKDLRRFTTLPRLQHLALGVSWYDGIPRSIAPAEPSHTLRTFKILNHDSHAGFDVTLLAQQPTSND
ncbi:hypothetical protein FRC09_010043 [Ceratobasidium sp. 395]|nr:hypothetical protein FRC09_010043 [Ceratobasidium sp. 395]